MSAVRIGISAAFMYPDPNRGVFAPKTLCYVEADLARWIASQPGWEPVLIPDLPQDALNRLLDGLEAVVFQGGTDLAPETYGSAPDAAGRWKGDPARDAYELQLMEQVFLRKMPVLGVCRGAQLLNVYLGGTHCMDLPSMRPSVVTHRDADRYDHNLHAIEWAERGFLAQVYAGAAVKRVNSVHHQGMLTVGAEVRVEAICPEDGLIEAICWTGDRPGRVLGVQWHPEFSWNAPQPVLDPMTLLAAWQGVW
jgi:putative glutamine amidotransferase